MEQDLNDLIKKMEILKEEQNCIREKMEEAINEYNLIMAEAYMDDDEEETEEICNESCADGIKKEDDDKGKEFFKVAGLMAVSALLGYALGRTGHSSYTEVAYGE